jgi:hypothetical protein
VGVSEASWLAFSVGLAVASVPVRTVEGFRVRRPRDGGRGRRARRLSAHCMPVAASGRSGAGVGMGDGMGDGGGTSWGL